MDLNIWQTLFGGQLSLVVRKSPGSPPCTVESLIIQAKLWAPDCQAGRKEGCHLQASAELIIETCMDEAGPQSLQVPSSGSGQGQRCWMTEGWLYWQFWHSLLREKHVQKGGTSFDWCSLKAEWFRQSSCWSCSWRTLNLSQCWNWERAEQPANGSVALNCLSQVSHCTNSAPLLSKKVPVCPGMIKLVLHLVGLKDGKWTWFHGSYIQQSLMCERFPL